MFLWKPPDPRDPRFRAKAHRFSGLSDFGFISSICLFLHVPFLSIPVPDVNKFSSLSLSLSLEVGSVGLTKDYRSLRLRELSIKSIVFNIIIQLSKHFQKKRWFALWFGPKRFCSALIVKRFACKRTLARPTDPVASIPGKTSIVRNLRRWRQRNETNWLGLIN